MFIFITNKFIIYIFKIIAFDIHARMQDTIVISAGATHNRLISYNRALYVYINRRQSAPKISLKQTCSPTIFTLDYNYVLIQYCNRQLTAYYGFWSWCECVVRRWVYNFIRVFLMILRRYTRCGSAVWFLRRFICLLVMENILQTGGKDILIAILTIITQNCDWNKLLNRLCLSST